MWDSEGLGFGPLWQIRSASFFGYTDSINSNPNLTNLGDPMCLWVWYFNYFCPVLRLFWSFLVILRLLAVGGDRYPSLLSSNIGWQQKRKTLLRAPLWAIFHITREQVGYWWLICAQATWESKYSSKVRLCLILIRPSSRPPQQTHHLLPSPPPTPNHKKEKEEERDHYLIFTKG